MYAYVFCLWWVIDEQTLHVHVNLSAVVRQELDL